MLSKKCSFDWFFEEEDAAWANVVNLVGKGEKFPRTVNLFWVGILFIEGEVKEGLVEDDSLFMA